MKKREKRIIMHFDVGSSLLVQSLRVGLVLFVFLFAIFIFKPQKSSFFASVKTDEFELHEGDIEEMKFQSEAMLMYTSRHVLIDFMTDNIIINGKEYKIADNGEDSITIQMKPFEDEGSIFVESEKRGSKITGSFSIDDLSLLRGIINGDTDHLSLYSDIKRREIDVDHCSGPCLRSSESFSIKTKGLLIYIGDLTDEDLVNSELEGTHWSNESTKEDVTLVFPNGGYHLVIGAMKYFRDELPFYHNIRIFSPEIEKMSISGSKAYRSNKSSGNISVYYNPEPSGHEFVMQEMNLESDSKTISTYISSDGDKYQLTMSGYAEQIKLAGNSLLPAFINMIKENAYLQPTIFVTIIVGAISLIKIHKDERKIKGPTISEKTAKRLGITHQKMKE